MARQPSPSTLSETDRKTQALKTTPHSLEAEQAVLGGILLSNDKFEEVIEHVYADDFYTFAHRVIFQEMEALARANKPVDIITLDEHLKNKGVSEEVGGFAYLAELSRNTPSAANVLTYANVVREKAIQRELIGAALNIVEQNYEPKGQDIKALLDNAEKQIFDIAEKRTNNAKEGPKPIVEILDDTLQKIEILSQAKNNNGVTGVSTGYTSLDLKTTGLQKSDLIIVAARPSMGKTTFAMNLCENAMMSQTKPVLVFSLEMPADSIAMRMLASLARVDQTKVRTGRITDDDEWSRITGVVQMMSERGNLYIDDSSGLTPTELRSRARRVYRENGGLSLIMVDYLQLMRAPGYSENRTLEIAEISRSLKALAKELEVPVIALSQLNRSLENRADKRPVNSDLRESGSIEQDADLIMFIYRDEVYNEHSEFKNIAEIIIGKQRNGPIGKVRLTFNGRFSRFDNYDGPAYNEDE